MTADHRSAPRTAHAGRRAVRLEQLTVAYNVGEGLVAVAAGLSAGLVSLLGFGLDSAIEVAAALVVLRRLNTELRAGRVDEHAERRALRFIAVTFFALAAYVTAEGVAHLLAHTTPDTSLPGVIVTGVSAVVMPILASVKRRTGLTLGSALLVADAAETRLCGWLSASTFAGLLAYTVFGWNWLDAVAGFVVAAFALSEGREAWHGELVCDDD